MARASLEELLEDYRDWLRNHDSPLWDKNSIEALYVRKLASGRIEPPGQDNGTNGTNGTNGNGHPGNEKQTKSSRHSSHQPHSSHPPSNPMFATFRAFFDTRPPAVVANILVCLIHQTNYLLDQQIKQLENAFLESGGLRESMTRARLNRRDHNRSRQP